jgi:hypothetical protein
VFVLLLLVSFQVWLSSHVAAVGTVEVGPKCTNCSSVGIVDGIVSSYVDSVYPYCR